MLIFSISSEIHVSFCLYTREVGGFHGAQGLPCLLLAHFGKRKEVLWAGGRKEALHREEKFLPLFFAFALARTHTLNGEKIVMSDLLCVSLILFACVHARILHTLWSFSTSETTTTTTTTLHCLPACLCLHLPATALPTPIPVAFSRRFLPLLPARLPLLPNNISLLPPGGGG